jgi:hypothetical protein
MGHLQRRFLVGRLGAIALSALVPSAASADGQVGQNHEQPRKVDDRAEKSNDRANRSASGASKVDDHAKKGHDHTKKDNHAKSTSGDYESIGEIAEGLWQLGEMVGDELRDAVQSAAERRSNRKLPLGAWIELDTNGRKRWKLDLVPPPPPDRYRDDSE